MNLQLCHIDTDHWPLHFWVLLAQRRRSSNDVQTSGNVSSANRENLEPNRASASLPESSFQTPARNDNVCQQPSHSNLGSCTGIIFSGFRTCVYIVYPSLYGLCVCEAMFSKILPHFFCPGTRICTSSQAGKTTKMAYYPTQSSGSNIILIQPNFTCTKSSSLMWHSHPYFDLINPFCSWQQ